ncbi:MAG TPA: hypothetical protein VG412_04680 [Acidimicrobiales bacterium]|jgi:hypothetical protein|nr:hypothetical protein [Acidimicrobiales bacterium]
MASAEPVSEATRRRLSVVLVVVAVIAVLYWVAWFAHRSLVASVHTAAYYQFENAFPLADGWLVVCLLGAAISLWAGRPAALLWLLAGGGAGLYLFSMDTLYDIQHGIWWKGGNGLVELGINIVTLVLSLSILRWAWARRHQLLPSAPG